MAGDVSAIEELYHRYFAAEQARDIDAVLQFFQTSGEFIRPNGAVVRGHEELRGFYEASAKRFPKVETRPIRVIGGPPTGVMQYEASLWEENGRLFQVRAVHVVTLSDGLFQRIESFFDSALLAA